MSWCKVKLGDFLVNRESRYKPKDKSIQGLKRIDKIDFSGKIYLSDKPSNTDMILIKNGDLVISGINVEKGAMSVYDGKDDVTATIHYSSYSFDENKIDLEFLKYFLKSAEFKQAIKDQVPGGIKTEIKPKHLLPLEIVIPTDVKDQKKFVSDYKRFENINNDISSEITNQQDIIKQLRQSFLREAMQGELVKQNTKDEPASELLKQIKAEKENLIKEKEIKKEKELLPIKEDELPFGIPENWSWCRLGEITNIQRGSSPRPKGDIRYFSKVKTCFNWITISDISDYCINNELQKTKEYLTEEGSKYSRYTAIDDFIIAVSGSTTGKCCLTAISGFIYDGLAVIKKLDNGLISRYLLYYMMCQYSIINDSKSGASFPNINTAYLNNILFPLPPLAEQKRIVEKLDQLMKYCDELEASIKESKKYNEQLLQQVLKEAFNN